MRIFRKGLSLFITAVGILIFSGFLNLKPIANLPAKAQAMPSSCSDVTGITAGVPSPTGIVGRPDGVFDSGRIDFNAAGISSPFQACKATDSSTLTTYAGSPLTPPVAGNLLKGWAWNTNLGYVSFYCQAGINQGGACGSQNYQSIISENKLKGFAWNDNVGWISLNCSGGAAGRNLNVACGSIYYGVDVATTDDQTGTGCTSGSGPGGEIRRGDLYGYAWNNSVGWMNFCGAHVDLTTYTADVNFTSSSDLSSTSSISGANVYANNNDYHEIKVIVRENGNPIVSDASKTIRITAGWDNTLKADQVSTTTCNPETTPSCTAARITEFAPNAANEYVSRITSVAPTTPGNMLSLTSLNVRIINAVTGAIIMEIPVPADQLTHAFTFLSPVSVTEISDGVNPSGSISTIVNGSISVDIRLSKNDSTFSTNVTLEDELYDCSASEYDFRFDTRTAESPSPPPPATYPLKSGVCPAAGNVSDVNIAAISFAAAGISSHSESIYTTIAEGATVADWSTSDALGLQTIINYTLGGKDVRYYSAQARGGIPNQAADIRGNVRIDIANITNLPAGGISQSLGEFAQTKREKFYRVIRNLIRRVPDWTGFNDGRITIDRTSAGNVNRNIYYLNKTNLETQPGDQTCTVRLYDDSDINFDHPATIISEGCNVFIDQNIISASGRAGRVGIIALEDLNTGKGGNVYICSGVTDVEANIVADGSLFSYGNGNPACGNENKTGMFNPTDGTPMYPSGTNIRDLLKHQLTITGSLTSNNTYGGSTANPLVMCDGSRGNASIPTQVNIARSCDINFLRYAKTIADSESPTGLCWTSDILKSRTLRNYDNCGFNFPGLGEAGGRSIVNIIYREPSRDLPVFNAVR